MGFYLHIEVNSSLSPSEFRERVITPLGEALEREELGRVLDGHEEDDTSEGTFELALHVTDQERARAVVEELLRSIDSGGQVNG
jgi:hypothetical protein